uniref:Uncharacterized protein n=1 Tax=Pseudo-nitzschia delicatissima TaxID=44447 RepID=A0A7S0UG58_9STRA|mmetsp:Transcript_3005/g.6256  ORF Transcript_3005/g.6256 Transcript_3005/m.6256 type:complete len:132 (+) Transcript_3005:74-469(+)
MMFLLKESAASTSFAAMFLLYLTGLLVLVTIGPNSHLVNAFQLHRLGPRTCKTVIFAARRDGATDTLPHNTRANSIHKNYNDNIAKVWVNSLETKIPLQASSRQYLSESSQAYIQSLIDEDTKETNQNHVP